MKEKLKKFYKDHDESITVGCITFGLTATVMALSAIKTINAQKIVHVQMHAPLEAEDFLDDKLFKVIIHLADGRTDNWRMDPIVKE